MAILHYQHAYFTCPRLVNPNYTELVNGTNYPITVGYSTYRITFVWYTLATKSFVSDAELVLNMFYQNGNDRNSEYSLVNNPMTSAISFESDVIPICHLRMIGVKNSTEFPELNVVTPYKYTITEDFAMDYERQLRFISNMNLNETQTLGTVKVSSYDVKWFYSTSENDSELSYILRQNFFNESSDHPFYVNGMDIAQSIEPISPKMGLIIGSNGTPQTTNEGLVYDRFNAKITGVYLSNS